MSTQCVNSQQQQETNGGEEDEQVREAFEILITENENSGRSSAPDASIYPPLVELNFERKESFSGLVNTSIFDSSFFADTTNPPLPTGSPLTPHPNRPRGFLGTRVKLLEEHVTMLTSLWNDPDGSQGRLKILLEPLEKRIAALEGELQQIKVEIEEGRKVAQRIYEYTGSHETENDTIPFSWA